MSDVLTQLQEDVAAMLQAEGFFAEIAVIMERAGTPENDAKVALETRTKQAGKVGACVLVSMPTLTTDAPSAPGPHTRAVLLLRALVRPRIAASAGGAQVTAEQIGLALVQTLQLRGWRQGLTLTVETQALQPVDGLPEGTMGYDVAVGTALPLARQARAQMVGFTLAGSLPSVTVTLASETAGAVMYYTTDGSYPWSGNEAASLYTTPITITSGCTVRAVAYHEAFAASSISEKLIS